MLDRGSAGLVYGCPGVAVTVGAILDGDTSRLALSFEEARVTLREKVVSCIVFGVLIVCMGVGLGVLVALLSGAV